MKTTYRKLLAALDGVRKINSIELKEGDKIHGVDFLLKCHEASTALDEVLAGYRVARTKIDEVNEEAINALLDTEVEIVLPQFSFDEVKKNSRITAGEFHGLVQGNLVIGSPEEWREGGTG